MQFFQTNRQWDTDGDGTETIREVPSDP